MKEDKKSHVTNVMRRTATLKQGGTGIIINGGMAGSDGGMANGERKMPISQALLFFLF